MMLHGLVAVLLAVGWDTCSVPALLPAYSHNDYNNRRPLLDALDNGYRGVEADIIRQGSDLIVAHDRRDLRPTRTLARLYLQPLRERKRTCGFVLPDSTAFDLNLEVKEKDPQAFRLLIAELRRYAELFESDSGGAPAVRVILVGAWIPVDSQVAAWPSYLKVHAPMSGAAGPRTGLISIDYGKTLRWDGRGPIPQLAEETLARARRMRDSLHVPIRVHHAPAQANVFKWLLAEGVTLIGAGNLERTRTLLLAVCN